jgi:hypothetical protein
MRFSTGVASPYGVTARIRSFELTTCPGHGAGYITISATTTISTTAASGPACMRALIRRGTL